LRIKDVILGLMSLALIGAGATLIITFFVGPSTRGDSPSEDPQDFNVPVLEEKNAKSPGQVSGPEDKTLLLSIPKMEIFEALVPDAAGNDEDKLRDYVAIHLEDTGFPWETGTNVYIAGHRLGYPDTASFLAFYDLDALEEGDEVTLLDADGARYAYTVFKKSVVSPTDLSVTQPVEGKDVLTLQTCTLPDYSQRLIVQAEKVV
jgi:sortase A